MRAFIIITSGTLAGEYHILTEGTAHTIGRASSVEWRIDDERVSRYHCVLWVNHGEVYIRDLGSRNGTYINGEQLAPGDMTDISTPRADDYPWRPGEELRIGDLMFQLVLEEQPDAQRPALRIKVRGRKRHANGKRVLEPVSATVEPPVISSRETVQLPPPEPPPSVEPEPIPAPPPASMPVVSAPLSKTSEFTPYTHK